MNSMNNKMPLSSIVIIAVIIMFTIMAMFPVMCRSRISASRIICIENLTMFYKGMLIYKETYGDKQYYMPHVGDAFFTCLLGHSSPEHPLNYTQNAPCRGMIKSYICDKTKDITNKVIPGGIMFDYMGPRRSPLVDNVNPSAVADNVPEDYPIACDALGNHDGVSGFVLYFNGNIRFLVDDEYMGVVGKCAD